MPKEILFLIVIVALSQYFSKKNKYSETLKNQLKYEEKIKKKAIKKSLKKPIINYENRNHSFVVGTTGSGKTASLLTFAEDSIKNGEFLVYLDGKATDGEHSPMNTISFLCEKYSRKLLVIDLMNPQESVGYNPFGSFEDSMMVADAFLDFGEFSEPYYKNNLMRYIVMVAEILFLLEKPLTFSSITDLLAEPKQIVAILNSVEARKIISKEDIERFTNTLKTTKEHVQQSSSQYLKLMESSVGRMILDNKESTNILKAYEKNAVILFKLDSFKYSEFAKSIGWIILKEMLIFCYSIQKLSSEKKATFILDEISVYYSDTILSLLSKAREPGIRCILATQSLSDLEPVASERIIENCNSYLVLRQNNPKSAQIFAEVFGTKLAQSITNQTEGIDFTGQGTVTENHEFLVNPNEIKNLPNLVGYYYQKGIKDIPRIFKIKFVNKKKR